MTECALLQLAADYIRSVYHISTIHSIINVQNGLCQTKLIYKRIDAELEKLKIDKKRLKSAIETVAKKNTHTDLFKAFSGAVHFDNERFDDGAILISQGFDAAVTSAKKEKYKQSRESVGSLLHTVQDFYSHSNWIEIGHRDPNKGIGKYQILGRYATRGMRTCINCDGNACRADIDPLIIEENVLTSGYFGLKFIGLNSKPIGKCSHGGSSDKTVNTDARGGGINKDNLKSPHGYLHKLAASVAFNATKQILEEFRTMIGTDSFGEFLGISSNLRNSSSNSLIIVMDDTASMGLYIEMAKQIAIGIVEIHQSLEYQPSNYILSPFNDPTWGPLTISKTPEEFTAEISKLTANGGGDEPELYYHGVLEALKVCEVGSFMYTFTDAPAKDAYLKSEAMQLAKEKLVTITLFYAKDRFRQEQRGRVSSKVDDIIEQLDVSDGSDLSSLTGGVIMGVNALALNATKDYIVQRLDADKRQTILFAKGKIMNLPFHIDTSIDSLHIEVTSTTTLSITPLRLITSSGEEIFPKPTSQTPFLRMYNIPIGRREIGEWIMISTMTIEHTVHINAISLVSCSSILQQEIIESSSNISFTPLTNQPIGGQTDLFVLTSCENLQSDIKHGYIHLVDADDASKTLETLSPILVSSTGFLSKIRILTEDFRLSTIVQLEDNTKVQRQEKQIISATSISITINDQPYTVILNEVLVINYTIYNHGQSQMTITLRTTDNLGLLPSTGVLKTYKIEGSNNFNDSIEINPRNLPGMDSNSTVLTDSIVFSISTDDYEYNEAVLLYIQREKPSLTNQTEYQIPPKVTGEANSLHFSLITFLLFFFFSFQI